MIQIDALFDAYLDANFLLAEAVVLWFLACLALRLAGIRPAPRVRMFLLNGVCLAVLVSPLLVAVATLGGSYGLGPDIYSVNLTDFVLSQYLNGRIGMRPSEFEHVLGLRDSYTNAVVSLNSAAGLATVMLLGLGAALFAGRMAVNVLRLRRAIRSSYGWHRRGSVHIRVSDMISVPFSARGLSRRYVVIPSELLAHQRDLSIVLQHEFQHHRQGDVELEIFMEALRLVFFWNPAFYVWKRQIEDLRELACDQRVLARKSVSVQSYCECLFRVCQNNLRRDPARVPVLPLVGLIPMPRLPFRRRSLAGLHRRIATMIDGRQGQGGRYLATLVVIPLAIIVATSAVAIQRPEDWSHDRIMLSTIVNLERLDAINSLSGNRLR